MGGAGLYSAAAASGKVRKCLFPFLCVMINMDLAKYPAKCFFFHKVVLYLLLHVTVFQWSSESVGINKIQ